MSKTSTTTLLFTILFLHLASTTISTHVRRDSSAATGSWTQDFHPKDHKPTPGIDEAPRFIINPTRPRKALAEIASGFNKAAESDHKPIPEKKAPPRLRIQPVKSPNAGHLPKKPIPSQPKRKTPVQPTPDKKAPPRFRIQPVKPKNVEHLAKKPIPIQPKRKRPVPPTPDNKAPPRFRIQPMKPRNVEELAKKSIPSQPKRKTPVPPSHFHKVTAPTKPHRHLIRRSQNPNLPTPSPTAAAVGKKWCVAKADASDQVLHGNINYACNKGVDCTPIQKGGDCFNSTSLRMRASFVMNAFYNINGRKDFNCYFGQSGVLTSSNPSHGKCIYL